MQRFNSIFCAASGRWLAGLALAALAMPMVQAQEQPSQSPDASAEDSDVIAVLPDMATGGEALLPGQVPTLPEAKGRPYSVGNKSSKVPSVLAILAHPDDELTIAPVLSRVAREGGRVTLVFATSGDAGPGSSGLPPGEELAALREDEARCAAFGLGLDEPIFWRFGDGTLADQARSADPRARDLSARIAALIDLEEPDTVMTWGADGGYGHADHRMISNAVTQAVQAMGPDRPDLLYAAFPATEDAASLPGFEGWALTHPTLITDRIRYEVPDLDAAQIAANCYVSQFPETARAVLTDMLHDRVWRGAIMFRMAFQPTR